MHSPYGFDGPCTVEHDGKIVMHDTIEDALVYGATHGCHLYEATFTPMVDMEEVICRRHAIEVERLVREPARYWTQNP